MQHLKKPKIIVLITSVLIVLLLAIATWLVLADAHKKAEASAKQYDTDITAYIDSLVEAKDTDGIKKAAAKLPKVVPVTFGEYTEAYRVAQSKEIIETIYRDRLIALISNYDDYTFDDEFRKLDSIRGDLPTKESEALRKAENQTRDKLDKLRDELLDIYTKDLSDTSKEYTKKQSEVKNAEFDTALKPSIATYTTRLNIVLSYKKKLEKIPTNDLTEQYKQGMMRALDTQIRTLRELISKVKEAKTPGEIRRLEHRYDQIQYENAEFSYHDARWASEEIFYGNPNASATYTTRAMRYIAEAKTLPTDKNEATLYADVIYYGHQSAGIIPKDKKYFSRTTQAKLRFNLNQLRYSIDNSAVDSTIKAKYKKLAEPAYATIQTMPGNSFYDNLSTSGRMHSLMSFVNFLSNYSSVSYGSSVVDSDTTEERMRYEAAGIRSYYNDVKKEFLPNVIQGKKERAAFIKQLDTCMEIRFDYNDQWISDTITLSKIKGNSELYVDTSDKLSAKRDTLANKYAPCMKKAGKLYTTAEKSGNNYAAYRKLAIKQLSAIK